MSFHTYTYHAPFRLESGEILPGFRLGYHTFGELNETKSNVVWVFHALTGSSNVKEWWADLFDEQSPVNTNTHFIICVNMPGSCYGSTGPLSINPLTDKPWFHQFPFLTIRDMVRMYILLKKELGIHMIHLAIGGSMGGMQALEWAIEEPIAIKHLTVIASNAQHSPWGKAFNAAQRMAIESDATWTEQHELAGYRGLKTARAIAMLSYRNYHPFQETQQDTVARYGDFKAESYLCYQGEKLAQRFNAFSYYALSKSMDAHHVGRNRKSVIQALQRVKAKTMVIGIESDLLFPIEEQMLLANHIPHAVFRLIDSPYGHDGFLIETHQIKQQLQQLLFTQKQIYALT